MHTFSGVVSPLFGEHQQLLCLMGLSPVLSEELLLLQTSIALSCPPTVEGWTAVDVLRSEPRVELDVLLSLSKMKA